MNRKRLRELAGINESEDRSIKQLIIVTNPLSPNDELDDIMFRADISELFLIFRGMTHTPAQLGLKAYTVSESAAAKADAEQRLKSFRDE